jgi:hypothetical protein
VVKVMAGDSATLSIKDRYIAAAFCFLLLVAYITLAIKGLDTKFLENILLVMIGVLGGLLKSSQATVGQSKETNINT